eukprot:COSAG01_NODE_503_length_16167_cov_10.407230_28_plen_67_part_00
MAKWAGRGHNGACDRCGGLQMHEQGRDSNPRSAEYEWRRMRYPSSLPTSGSPADPPKCTVALKYWT